MMQHESSLAATVHLVRALRPHGPVFDRNAHLDAVKTAQVAHRQASNSAHDLSLEVMLGDGEGSLADLLAKRMAAVRGTGHWLAASPSTRQGEVLTADEFRAGISTRYAKRPPFLQDTCDGCALRLER